MPKVISEREREQTRNAIIESIKQLICTNNGIKNITVDDIANSVGIGKGSFYSYYNSKEECLYAVIKKWESELVEQFEIIMEGEKSRQEKITTFLRENYLSDNSLNRYISPTDKEVLLRKLPPEFSEVEKEKSNNYIANFMKSLNLDIVQMEALGALLDCIGYVFSYTAISKQGKNEALDTLIKAIVEYIEKNGG